MKEVKDLKLILKDFETIVKQGDTWKHVTLDDVCEISSKLVDPRKPDFIDLVHVGGANIQSVTGKLILLKTSREEKLISGKFLFDQNMVLYSKIRPYLMKVARPEFRGLCSADIYPLLPKPNKILRDYLYHLLLSKNFTEYAIKGSARAGMPKVNREHLFAYNFWIPPQKEQKQIISKLDTLFEQTKKLEQIYQRKLELLQELKQSVLQKAFAGEL
ncbi:MAG: restriction endonuclease subunit S [bacterium]|nr:restriction endonuclease subunit S [bacterium]